MEVRLHRIADLRDESSRAILDLSYQELTGDWVNSPGIAPTQSLGEAVHRSRLEVFVHPASKVGGKNLVIFPDRLVGGSTITFGNDLSGRSERLR